MALVSCLVEKSEGPLYRLQADAFLYTLLGLAFTEWRRRRAPATACRLTMCGISLLLQRSGSSDGTAALLRMHGPIRHRGPDGQGFLSSGPTATPTAPRTRRSKGSRSRSGWRSGA